MSCQDLNNLRRCPKEIQDMIFDYMWQADIVRKKKKVHSHLKWKMKYRGKLYGWSKYKLKTKNLIIKSTEKKYGGTTTKFLNDMSLYDIDNYYNSLPFEYNIQETIKIEKIIYDY